VEHSLVQSPVTTQPPQRVARLPRQSNKPPAYVNQATQSAIKTAEGLSETTVDKELLADSQRIRRQNSALWFIMLCSVGLNFYLSWIARGFYMRYEELADELRETFSTTM
jgi:hypothetical protein